MKFLGAVTLACVPPALVEGSTPHGDHLKRGLTLEPRAGLVKRSVVGDVFTSLEDIVATRKVNLNQVLVSGVNGLQGISKTIDYNTIIPKGFNNAIDQNQQLAQLPFGSTVGDATKSVLGGIDYSSFINTDVFNFLNGAVANIDANAITLSGLNAISAALGEPAAAGKAAAPPSPAKGSAATSTRAAGAASTSALSETSKAVASAASSRVAPASSSLLVLSAAAAALPMLASLCL